MRGILSHRLTFSSTFAGVALTACFGGMDVLVARRQPRNLWDGC